MHKREIMDLHMAPLYSAVRDFGRIFYGRMFGPHTSYLSKKIAVANFFLIAVKFRPPLLDY